MIKNKAGEVNIILDNNVDIADYFEQDDEIELTEENLDKILEYELNRDTNIFKTIQTFFERTEVQEYLETLVKDIE